MKKKILLPVILYALLCYVNIAFAQTGVFYYDSYDNDFPNTQIVDLKEAPGGEIYILGKSTDSTFQTAASYFARIDKNGKMILQNKITANSLYEIKNLIILPDGNIKIYGTETSQGAFRPYSKTIDNKGESLTEEATLSFNPTLLCNAEQIDNNNALISQTVQGVSQKFNISVYQVELENFNQVWYKKLTSEWNEEATQIYLTNDSNIIIPAKKYNAELTAYTPIIYKLNSKGGIIWRNDITDVDSNFNTQSVITDKQGNIIYSCSYQNEKDFIYNSKILKISQEGKVISSKILDSIAVKGILQLANGNMLLYGSGLISAGIYAVAKAKIIVLNNSFEKQYSREMDFLDPPDSELPSLAMTMKPTSSDLVAARILSDGRIVCGGRVYMPKDKDPEKIIFSTRYNNPFLIFLDKEGKLY